MDKFNHIWSIKYRPVKVEDMALSKENMKHFSELEKLDSHLLFVGKTGVGKTTLAKILAKKFAPDSYLFINASDESGVDFIRTKIKDFVQTKAFSLTGQTKKIVILDEADGLSNKDSGNGSSAQQALRSMMETYADNCVFILTGNYSNMISSALHSRCQLFEFHTQPSDVMDVVKKVLKAEEIKYGADDIPTIKGIVKKHYPDIRKILNELQRFCSSGTFEYIEVETADDDKFVNTLLSGVYKDLFKTREFVINNEDKFEGDYHQLLKTLFNVFIAKQKRKEAFLCVRYMHDHNIVMDKEVNFYGFLFELSQIAE
jgi:DNA polymerase III delta prime subunit